MKDEDPNSSKSSTTGSSTNTANDPINKSVNESVNNDTNKKAINTISNVNGKNLDNKTNKIINKDMSIKRIVKKSNTLQTINIQATRKVEVEQKLTTTVVTEDKVSHTGSFTPKTIKATIKARPSIKTPNHASDSSKQSQSIVIIKPKSMSISYPDSYKPAVVHALFNPKRTIIDPARPLSDIPEPASRFPTYLLQLNDEFGEKFQTDYSKHSEASNKQGDTLNRKKTHDNHWYKTEDSVSKWDLIKSTALAEHIQLLEAGELAKFPNSFYNNNHNNIRTPLLSSLADMAMVDMSDIRAIMTANPTLNRQGFVISSNKITLNKKSEKAVRQVSKSINKTEIQNTDYADDWEVVLYPQRFDEATTLFHTDIMACSIAKHALSQCDERKSINSKLSIHDITNAVRSYQLSQCKELPAMREQLRRTGIYAGHIIIASILLNLDRQANTDTDLSKNIKSNKLNLNLSSRSALFTRYPILSSYYINGWQ